MRTNKAIIISGLLSEWVFVEKERNTLFRYDLQFLEEFLEEISRPHFNKYDILRINYADLDKQSKDLLDEINHDIITFSKESKAFNKLWNLYKED